MDIRSHLFYFLLSYRKSNKSTYEVYTAYNTNEIKALDIEI